MKKESPERRSVGGWTWTVPVENGTDNFVSTNRVFGWVMPRTATLISRDRSGAYRYLPRSVGTFMSRSEMCGRLAGAGFSDVTATGLSLGISVCYRAFKRA